MYNDRSAHLVQSYIHPSLWFIAEGPRDSTLGIPPFDNRLRSDEWTANLHKHRILGYVGVYVDDLLIAGPRSLSDTLIKAVQGIWKMSAPEHLGPDPDCVPILRFLGMNLERVDEERSKELDLPIGSVSIEPDGVCLRCTDEVRAQSTIEDSHNSRESRVFQPVIFDVS